MEGQIELRVYRRRDELKEGLPGDSPLAFELHQLRANTLHEIFDSEPAVNVINWGETDDSDKTHEVVELVLQFAEWVTQPDQLQAISTASLEIGKFLAAAAVGESVKEGVKWLFERLRKKQEEGKITDVYIKVTPTVNVQVDVPEHGGRVYVSVQVAGKPYGTDNTE